MGFLSSKAKEWYAYELVLWRNLYRRKSWGCLSTANVCECTRKQHKEAAASSGWIAAVGSVGKYLRVEASKLYDNTESNKYVGLVR